MVSPKGKVTKTLGSIYQPITGYPAVQDQSVEFPGPWRIALLIERIKVQLIFELKTEAIVGRLADNEPDAVFVDLRPFITEDDGVSRRHVRISRQGDRVYVTDLQSSNGTHLNGVRLPSEQPHQLQHGSELTLGILDLRVDFLFNPFK